MARTVSSSEVVSLGKTARSGRQVPLTRRALAALDALPARLDTPWLFPAPEGGVLNIDNFRRRKWAPAVAASGVPTPARLYDLRSTFASEALAAGVTVFELARVMGHERGHDRAHYGACSTAPERASPGVWTRSTRRTIGPAKRVSRSFGPLLGHGISAVTSSIRRNYLQIRQSGRRVSNPRPSAWEADALPTELRPRCPADSSDPAARRDRS